MTHRARRPTTRIQTTRRRAARLTGMIHACMIGVHNMLNSKTEVAGVLSKIDDRTREFLLLQPESGMGYQLVQRNDNGDRLLILNAELSINVKQVHEIAGYQDHGGMIVIDSGDLETLSITPQNITVITHGSYPSNSRKDEIFVRYSAFQNDRRIRNDDSVMSGAYVTTENDARCWWPPIGLTGLSVVGRYALPNPAPAIYRFLLRPARIVPIACGTVAPNHGQSGGGVEVRFERDTSPDTVIERDTIPDR